MNFKINSRQLFTIIFKLKNDIFKTRDFSPLIERILAGVYAKGQNVLDVVRYHARRKPNNQMGLS